MAVTKVVMPKLSDAMESGKIIKWLKKEGDRINSGDILAEVETDKADVEMEAFGAGVLRKVLVPAGGVVPVGGLIGVIAEPGDDIGALVSQATTTPGGPEMAPRTPQPAQPAKPSAPAAPAPAAGPAAMSDRPSAVPPMPRREDHSARTPAPSTRLGGPEMAPQPPPPAQPAKPAAPAQQPAAAS